MKPLFTLIIVMLVLGPVFGQVKSDYDKATDFSRYETYSFEGWEQNSDQILNDFDKKRITDALKAEFAERGMTLVESGGDAAITLFIVVDQKSSTTAYTNYNGAMGYGGRWGWGYGGTGMATTTYSENDYKEGTLVVDMYDGAEMNLVWQGIITTVVKEKPEQREKSIPKKIGKLMNKFPKE